MYSEELFVFHSIINVIEKSQSQTYYFLLCVHNFLHPQRLIEEGIDFLTFHLVLIIY